MSCFLAYITLSCDGIPVKYNFFGPEKAVHWAGKGVKTVIDSCKKELRIVPTNNLKEIYEYSLHEHNFLILSCVRFTESFLGKIFI